MRSSGHNRLEAGPPGSAATHLHVQGQGHVRLSPPHQAIPDYGAERGVSQLGGLADPHHLVVVLDRAKPLDRSLDAHQCDAVRQQLLQSLMLAHRHAGVLKAQPQLAAGQDVGDRLEQLERSLAPVE